MAKVYEHMSYYTLYKVDLPFFCPPKNERIDIAHPKVFLDFSKNNKVRCPYCSTEYVLEDC